MKNFTDQAEKIRTIAISALAGAIFATAILFLCLQGTTEPTSAPEANRIAALAPSPEAEPTADNRQAETEQGEENSAESSSEAEQPELPDTSEKESEDVAVPSAAPASNSGTSQKRETISEHQQETSPEQEAGEYDPEEAEWDMN